MDSKNDIKDIVGDYKYGFSTQTESVITSGKGLSREVVEFISNAKGEPAWMKDFRLNSYDAFVNKSNPTWGPDLSGIDFNEYTYYIKSTEKTENNWDDVPDEIKETFEKLGIPEAEAKYLAGSSTQFESEVVYHNNLKELYLKIQKILFLQEHRELVKHILQNRLQKNWDVKMTISVLCSSIQVMITQILWKVCVQQIKTETEM